MKLLVYIARALFLLGHNIRVRGHTQHFQQDTVQRILGVQANPGLGEDRGCLDGQQIQSELGRRLSKEATFVLPSSLQWDEVLSSASFPRLNPSVVASIEPATDGDVQEIVGFPLLPLL